MKSQFNNLITVVFVSFIAVFTEGSALAADTNFIPKNFSTSIGGWHGASYSVDIKDGVLNYSKSAGKKTNEFTLTPTLEQWKTFKSALNSLNVWKWKSDYINLNILDGTSWSLDIEYSDRKLHARGANDHPTQSGKANGKPEPTEAFNTYLAAVRKLLGGKEFE